MTKHFNDSAHWRSRAEEARAIAERLEIPDAKRMMYEIASDYEHLAARAERRLAGQYTTRSGLGLRRVESQGASLRHLNCFFSAARDDVLIPLQQPGNARDRAGELPRVSFADALHARLPYRLVLKINESKPLSVGVQYDVRLSVLLDPPWRRVSAAGGHAL